MSYLVFVGVIIHLILVYSMFDIYYISPVVTGIPAHEIAKNDSPAKRVVIISADGLRHDMFIQNPDRSPYLHSIIRDRKGISGISRSHIPTESRPGHVAIFAGFTEDVSAVASGWKHNPVQFDSIFNRSKESWLWGSPDIVSLFDDQPHIHSFSYSAENEDFGSKEAFKLDEWVFNRVENFLMIAKNNVSLVKSLNSDKIVFFLHLLGIDTNGHGNKPYSKEYLENLAVVDAGIIRMQHLFDSFFADNRTAWIFTSDHGMTDWGSHGGGSDDEILTPFITWGAGIKKGGARRTISQVDITPLISSLLGLPIPVNSIGVLPIEVLDVFPNYLFRSSFANFLQLKEQLLALRNEKAKRLWFRDYKAFGDHSLNALEVQLLKLAKLSRFAPAASLFVENAASLKHAIFHYHRYDQSFLAAAVSMSFIGWVLLLLCYLMKNRCSPLFCCSIVQPNKFFAVIFILMLSFCAYCRLPWTNFIYVLLPVILFSMVENSIQISYARTVIVNIADLLTTSSLNCIAKPILGFIVLSIFLSLCVLVFVDRRFLSAIFILLMLAPNSYNSPRATEWARTWYICCFCLMPFPFLATVGRNEIPLLCILSPIVLGCSLLCATYHPYLMKRSKGLKWLAYLQFANACIIFASNFIFKKPSYIIRSLSWCSLPFSLVLPFLAPPTIMDKTIWFICSLFVPYSLLSIAYESFFMLCFIPLLLIFSRIEFGHLTDSEFMQLTVDKLKDVKSNSRITLTEIRRAVIYVSFVLTTLFGTGNFASLNSFNPSTLSRFISIFSPFTMAILLITKLSIPLFMASLVLASVLRLDREAIQRVSCLVLIITDLMAMCFFHQLKDSGSWLEIGLSISQYLVAMCMSVTLLVLLLVSCRLMTISFSTFKSKVTEEKCGAFNDLAL